MFLAVNVINIINTSVFLISFVISYFVILCTNFEKIFKQGYIWAIRIGQVLIALICAYLITSGVMLLINSTQFTIN